MLNFQISLCPFENMCSYMCREEHCLQFVSTWSFQSVWNFRTLDTLYLKYSIFLPPWKISIESKAKPYELLWPVEDFVSFKLCSVW